MRGNLDIVLVVSPAAALFWVSPHFRIIDAALPKGFTIGTEAEGFEIGIDTLAKLVVP